MEKLKQKLTLLILIFSISQFSFAQKSGKIKGVVSDGKVAIEFTELLLKNSADSTKVVSYTVTDSAGNFSLDNLATGEYQLIFKLIGYKTEIQKIKITDENPIITLSNVVLQNAPNLLKAVVINSQKKMIQKTSEGIIFNVNNNISQIGGTATDLLKNIPTVSFDTEGGISLRGKTPLILINGKNSALTNIDQIAASSIENIEVITNPTAKYDANAESGIINIKLKKNNQNGINGAVAVGTGFGAKGRINSSVLLNHKTEKWNFGLGYDNRFAGRTKKIKGSRTNFFLTDEHFIEQNRDDERTEQLQNFKFNIDFSPNDENNFSFEAITNKEGQDNDETLKTLINKENSSFFSKNIRHSLELERSKVNELAFNYSKNFSDNRKSLNVNITSSFNKNRENTGIDTYNYNINDIRFSDAFLQKTHNYENENVSNLMLNYAFPISEKSHIETGYKGTFRFFDSNFQSADYINNGFVTNTDLSNIFKFNEQINAVYGMLNSFWGIKDNPKWKYNLGLRVEQVSNKGKTQNNNTPFSNDYLKSFPSASLQLNLKTNESIKISYSKRINRPELGQLNPFLDITDALNPHSGNPYLKPEIINIGELSYAKEWDKYSISTNGFYRNATNSIKQYSELQQNGIVLLYPKNFGTTITYGVETIFNLKPTKFYDANISLTGFQQNIDGSNIAEDVISKTFNWYGKIINNFTPWQGGKVQLIGNYNSALATAQGKRIAIYNIDMGVQQKLGNGNARLGLAITDLFNSLKSGYKNYTLNFTNNRTSKSDTRAVMITFVYSFKSTFKEKLLENQFTPEY